jgi:hypothetical protein
MSFITPLSYSDISDFSICEKRNKNELYKIKDSCKDNDLIYCDIPLLEKIAPFLLQICKNKNIKIRLVLSWHDHCPSQEILSLLNDCCYRIYSQNMIYKNDKYSPIPIGIRENFETPHYHIINEKAINRNKEHLAFMCFTLSSNPDERRECWEEMIQKPFVHYEPRMQYDLRGIEGQYHCGIVPIPVFYEHLHKSIFCICPAGDGIDTHRFYEAIYLDSIPIVKSGPLNKLFEQFPCLIIGDWNEVTYDYLKEVEPIFREKLQKFKLLRPNWSNESVYFIDNPIII